MQQIGLADYHQDIEQLDADLLVDQVARARRDGTEIADQIRRATAEFPARVRSILDEVARGPLRLDPSAETAHQLDEVVAWPRT
jgi:hypothetical protein